MACGIVARIAMNSDEKLRHLIRQLSQRPTLSDGPVEAVILAELGRIGRQIAGLEQMILARLNLAIGDYFNEAELQNLCFLLDVDYENLAGEGKAARIQSLVSLVHRNGRIGDLIQSCRELRPGGNF
jgi:hypothetical protein